MASINASFDDSVGYKTTTVSRNIIRFLTAYLKEYDITPEQWTVIKRLSEQDGITQKELSHRCDKDQPTITRILDILERKELIRKEQNGIDRRSFFIFVTEQGKNIKTELSPFIEDLFEHKLLKGIKIEELSVCKHVLARMNENIANDLEAKLLPIERIQ